MSKSHKHQGIIAKSAPQQNASKSLILRTSRVALGDLNTQSMAEVLRSDSYRASLAREANLIAGKCPSCALNGSCAGWPIVSTKSRGQFDDPCAIAPAVIMHIVKRLEEWGFGREELARMRLEVAAPAQYAGV